VGGAWCHFSRPALYVQPVSVQVPWAVLAAFCVGTGKMGMSELLGQRVFLAFVWGVLLGEPCGRCRACTGFVRRASCHDGFRMGQGILMAQDAASSIPPAATVYSARRDGGACRQPSYRGMSSGVIALATGYGRHWLWVSGWVTRTWCASMLAC
jgi:hypothetical protein